MNVLTILKHFINFIFYAFIPLSIGILIYPFMNPDVIGQDWKGTAIVIIILPAIHLLCIFFILYYLRNFVFKSFVGEPFQKSSRKYLKWSGIFCLIYSLIKTPQLFGLITFYRIAGHEDPSFILDGVFEFGIICLIAFVGLFLIYISKVFELSDQLKQENQLTI